MGFFSSIGHAFSSAVSSVAKVAIAPAVFVTKQTGNVLGHIPVIGTPLHAALNIASAPVTMTNAITSGARIDHAVMDGLKQQVQGVKDIAPYAKMVISVVPGVGQVASAAIAAGTALANGKRIDDALVEGVKGAIPLVAGATDLFNKGYEMAKLAPGDSVPSLPKMDAILAKLTPEKRKIFHSAIALGHAHKLQNNVAKAIKKPSVTLKLKAVAAKKIEQNPILSAGLLVLSDPAVKHGFEIGIGTFLHDVSPTELAAIKSGLHGPAELQGFNIAMAVRLGMALKVADGKMPPREKFGYYAVYGMQSATNAEKTLMLGTISHDNSARVGVTKAISEIKTGWWPKIVNFFHSHFHHTKTA